jgi:hypothetical protein
VGAGQQPAGHGRQRASGRPDASGSAGRRRPSGVTVTASRAAVAALGVPAGAPADLTVHVKNGWLPLATHGWRIHSIGCFTGHHRGYTSVVLTPDNPTMTYGISTIQRAAEVIHRQLNPAGTALLPPPAPYPSWGHPDERIPARLGGR